MKKNIYKLVIGIGLIIYAFISFDWGNPKYNGYFPYSNSEILAEFLGGKIFFWLPGAYFILFYFPKSRIRNIIKWVLNAFVIIMFLAVLSLLL